MLLSRPWLARNAFATKPKTVADVLDLYKSHAHEVGRKHLYCLSLLRDHLGPVTLDRLQECLDSYIAHRRNQPSPKTGRPLSGASLNRMTDTLRAALNLAVQRGAIKANPMVVRRFRKVARDRMLSVEEEGRLLGILSREAPHLYPLSKFALQVPCRKSELVNLEVTDISRDFRSVRVRNGEAKNDQGCDKPIPPDMVDYFRSIPIGCKWVFYRRDQYGIPVHLGDFKRAWVRALDIAGLRDFHFHDTRHISITKLLNAGTPKYAVMQIAGWKTDMLGTYYHRDGAQALDQVKFA